MIDGSYLSFMSMYDNFNKKQLKSSKTPETD